MTVETVLWWVAWISTGIFALKVIVMFLGAGMDVETDLHAAADAHSMSDEFQVLSILSILTLLMMGSWSALAALKTFELDTTTSLIIGLLAGMLTALLVSWSMFRMRKLEADGTLRDFDPRGLRGTVYAAIPAAGQGEGQVRLEVKGRLRIFRAVSTGEKIDSFQPVEIVDMTHDRVVRVKRAM